MIDTAGQAGAVLGGRARLSANRIALVFLLALWSWAACAYAAVVARGTDVAPLAIAGRLVAEGRGDLLYTHAPGLLAVEDPAWNERALKLGFGYRVFPYLYPPLLAHALAALPPVELRTMLNLLLGLNLAALLLTILLAAVAWAPDLLRPLPMLLILSALLVSRSLDSELTSLNVQPIVVFASVVAMVAGQRRRPGLAGTALAIAAAIKLTPAILVVHWIATGRVACLAWFIGISALLIGVGLWVAGVPEHLAYLGQITELARSVVPVSSNKSLAALVTGLIQPLDSPSAPLLRLVALPDWIRLGLGAVTMVGIGLAVTGARRWRDRPAADAAGMAALLLIAVIAVPIAWSLYFTSLVVPGMVWAGLRPSRPARLALWAVITILASLPATMISDAAIDHGWPSWAVGGELAAALILIGALLTARPHRFARDLQGPCS